MFISPYKSQTEFFIYCVGQCPERIQNFSQSMLQEKVAAKPLIGRYQGEDENSFISRMSDFGTIEPWLGAEESILELHNFNLQNRPQASLRFLGIDKVISLGQMVQVPREVAIAQCSYSYDPKYGTYFICTNCETLDRRFNF